MHAPLAVAAVYRRGGQVFYPFEATPLYVGNPALNVSTDPVLGGGFVEPLGFNSKPPDPAPAAGTQSPNGTLVRTYGRT